MISGQGQQPSMIPPLAQKTEYVHKHTQTDREKRGEIVDSKASKEKLSTSQLDELLLYCRA